MDSEVPKPGAKEIEGVASPIKLTYKFTDMYGQVFADTVSHELVIPDQPAPEAWYFEGTIETPVGDFVLECQVPEAKKAVSAIAEFVKASQGLKEIEEQIPLAQRNLRQAEDRWRARGDLTGYSEASSSFRNLQDRRLQLQVKLRTLSQDVEKYTV